MACSGFGLVRMRNTISLWASRSARPGTAAADRSGAYPAYPGPDRQSPRGALTCHWSDSRGRQVMAGCCRQGRLNRPKALRPAGTRNNGKRSGLTPAVWLQAGPIVLCFQALEWARSGRLPFRMISLGPATDARDARPRVHSACASGRLRSPLVGMRLGQSAPWVGRSWVEPSSRTRKGSLVSRCTSRCGKAMLMPARANSRLMARFRSVMVDTR